MATKAELEAELAALKAQLADRPDPASEETDEHRTTFDKVLSGYGIEASDLDTLWTQFSKELGDFPTQKPLLTTIAAFGLGFALGRLTKS